MPDEADPPATRPHSRFPSDDEVLRYVRMLRELAEETHPRPGEASYPDKYHLALRALTIAQNVAAGLAAWAIDQISGAYRRHAGETPDDHRLEEIGWRAGIDRPGPTDSAVERLFLARLLAEYPLAIPLWLRTELAEALDALNTGQILPLLRRQHGKGQNYLLWQERLRALEHVAFLEGLGLGSVQARERVAGAYGEASHENVRKWGERIHRVIPEHAIAKLLSNARATGEWTKRLLEYRSPADPRTGVYISLDRLWNSWDEESLRRSGARYQEVRRRAKG